MRLVLNISIIAYLSLCAIVIGDTALPAINADPAILFESFTQNIYFDSTMRANKNWIVFLTKSNEAGVIVDKNGTLQLLTMIPLQLPELEAFLNSDIDTDGEWVAVSYFTVRQSQLLLFKIENNGIISDIQNVTAVPVQFVRFLSDGTLIGLTHQIPTMYHFGMVNSTWTLIDQSSIPTPGIIFPSDAARLTDRLQKAVFALTDKHFFAPVKSTSSNVVESTRADDAFLWSKKRDFQANDINSLIFDIAWNGNDSILTGALYGSVQIYNGGSSRISITAESVGLPSYNYFGWSVLSVDQNTFLVSAPDFDPLTPQTGRVVVIKRQPTNSWKAVAMIYGSLNQLYFATAMAMTDRHIVFDGPTGIQSIPRCAVEPIQYDCQERVFFENCNNTSLDSWQYCSTLQIECSRSDEFEITKIYGGNSAVKIDFKIRRIGAETVTKTISIECNPNHSVINVPMAAVPSGNSPVLISPVSLATSPENDVTSDAYITSFMNSYSIVFELVMAILFVSTV